MLSATLLTSAKYGRSAMQLSAFPDTKSRAIRPASRAHPSEAGAAGPSVHPASNSQRLRMASLPQLQTLHLLSASTGRSGSTSRGHPAFRAWELLPLKKVAENQA